MMPITPTVKQLLILNILCYAGALFVGDPAYKLLSMYYPENPNFHFWQLLTHMFMHAKIPPVELITHLLFNMFALYSFGSALEHFWGGKKFLFFYFSCGLGSALLHNAVNYWQYHEGVKTLMDAGVSLQEIRAIMNTGMVSDVIKDAVPIEVLQDTFAAFNSPMLGASGAIYGLLVAFAFMVPNAEMFLMFIPVPIKAKYLIPGIITLDLVLGLFGNSIFGPGGSGIAHFAHLGGAFIGFLMMWYWKKDAFKNNRWN